LKHQRDSDLKVKLNEDYNNTMKINQSDRIIEHKLYIGPTKSLQEIIESGQAMGVDRALRNRHPIHHLTAEDRKSEI